MEIIMAVEPGHFRKYAKRLALLGAVLASAGCADLNYHPTIYQQHGWHEIKNSAKGKDWFDHVLIIVLENGEKKGVEEKASYLKQLVNLQSAGPGRAGLPPGVNAVYFDNYHGITHPSYSNYLAMVSGRVIESHWDNQQNIEGESIAARFKAANLVWRNYAEGYPGTASRCDRRDKAGDYARKHVPFLSFTSLTDDQCKNNIVPINFQSAIAGLTPAERWREDGKAAAGNMLKDWDEHRPVYSLYSPNLIHDGHNADGYSQGVKFQQMSNWLEGFFERLGSSNSFWERTLVVITFDESEASEATDNARNEIYTVFLGKVIEDGLKPETAEYNHFNLLRTIEENFGLGTMGEMDVAARAIQGIWKPNTARKAVVNE